MPYHDKGSKTKGDKDTDANAQFGSTPPLFTEEGHQQEQPLNPIVQVNLNALPGEMMFQITGKEYVGKFHIHQDL